MKLEDATKEELVWWIREHSFELRRAMGSFTSDIMSRKGRQWINTKRLWLITGVCWLHTKENPCPLCPGMSSRKGRNWSV